MSSDACRGCILHSKPDLLAQARTLKCPCGSAFHDLCAGIPLHVDLPPSGARCPRCQLRTTVDQRPALTVHGADLPPVTRIGDRVEATRVLGSAPCHHPAWPALTQRMHDRLITSREITAVYADGHLDIAVRDKQPRSRETVRCEGGDACKAMGSNMSELVYCWHEEHFVHVGCQGELGRPVNGLHVQDPRTVFICALCQRADKADPEGPATGAAGPVQIEEGADDSRRDREGSQGAEEAAGATPFVGSSVR